MILACIFLSVMILGFVFLIYLIKFFGWYYFHPMAKKASILFFILFLLSIYLFGITYIPYFTKFYKL